MSLETLGRLIAAGERLLLDSTALIAYLDGGESVSPVATHIIDHFVRSGRNRAVVSAVTAMEILVRPRRSAMPAGYRHVHDFLRYFPNLRVEPVDFTVAQEAAEIRAGLGFQAPDALVIGTGMTYQVQHLVTNDRQWQQKLTAICKPAFLLAHRCGTALSAACACWAWSNCNSSICTTPSISPLKRLSSREVLSRCYSNVKKRV